MEIKYTLEILTKDIQDIGKLVEKLQISPDGSTLELDLAMSKLRNVYDILNMIRRDMEQEALASKGKVPAPQQEAVPEPEPAPEPEPISQIPEPKSQIPESKPEPKPEPAPKPEPELTTETETIHTETKTLSEKFEAGSSINENMAGQRDRETDSKLMGNPIDSISRNIGINDRFLIIREVFEGDSDRFGSLIKELDSAEELEKALGILKDGLGEHGDHEGAGILDNLVRRRYSKN